MGLTSTHVNPDWTLESHTFSEIRIGTDGCILLGPQPELTTTIITTNNAPSGLLAPFLDDLTFTPDSRIYINYNINTEPVFTIQWNHMSRAMDTNTDLTFQIQLCQTSQQVRFSYLDLNGSNIGQTAFIGQVYDPTNTYVWTNALLSHTSLEIVDANRPFVDIVLGDRDGDYLSDSDEVLAGTDPKNWDTDDDRMGDGWEKAYEPLLNPLIADGSLDADADGYINVIEYYAGSDPTDANSPAMTQPDSDFDGMPDTWEVTHGFDTNTSADALMDSDHDWYINVLEYAIGGNPTNGADHGTHLFQPYGGANHATYP